MWQQYQLIAASLGGAAKRSKAGKFTERTKARTHNVTKASGLITYQGLISPSTACAADRLPKTNGFWSIRETVVFGVLQKRTIMEYSNNARFCNTPKSVFSYSWRVGCSVGRQILRGDLSN